MRQVINLSFPPTLVKEVKRAVKQEGYTNTSEFFRYLFRLWLEEDLLFQDLKESEDDVKAGRVYPIESLKDLR